MRFYLPQGHPLLLTLFLMGLVGGLSACTPQPPIYLNASGCSTLVPREWYAVNGVGANGGVPSAPLPAHDTIGDWVAFGNAQTGQLDKANDRTRSAVSIIQTCEARDAAAQARIAHPSILSRILGH